ETVNEAIDWTAYRVAPGWTNEMLLAFDRLTASSPGFMGKSQVLEFVKEIHKLFQPQISQLRRGRDRIRKRKIEQKDTINIITQFNTFIHKDNIHKDIHHHDDFYQHVTQDLALDSIEEGMRMVSFEMFHRVAMKLGLSVGHRHSRMLWIMVGFEDYEEIQQFLPERDVKLGIIRVYLQPITILGKPFTNKDEHLSSIVSYKGLINFFLFKRLLKHLEIIIPDKAARALWDELPKDPMEITDFLPAGLLEGNIKTKYLRLEMDNLGLDPMKGRVVSIDCLRKKLP
ncbi:EF hand domain-containing protein, putative, partial [Eimeria maxima]